MYEYAESSVAAATAVLVMDGASLSAETVIDTESVDAVLVPSVTETWKTIV